MEGMRLDCPNDGFDVVTQKPELDACGAFP